MVIKFDPEDQALQALHDAMIANINTELYREQAISMIESTLSQVIEFGLEYILIGYPVMEDKEQCLLWLCSILESKLYHEFLISQGIDREFLQELENTAAGLFLDIHAFLHPRVRLNPEDSKLQACHKAMIAEIGGNFPPEFVINNICLLLSRIFEVEGLEDLLDKVDNVEVQVSMVSLAMQILNYGHYNDFLLVQGVKREEIEEVGRNAKNLYTLLTAPAAGGIKH
ncbi:MAG: hypothetical protein WCL30_02635 [Pseudomonadota bacterium]